MKHLIAVCLKGDSFDSEIEDCFGKTEYFYIKEKNKRRGKFVINPVLKSDENNGKKAASFLIKTGVKSVISANFGAYVKSIFDKNKIQIIILPEKFRKLSDLNL